MAESFPLPPRLRALLADLPLEELAFAPVPVRARHDGWTAARQVAFILRLALSGSIGYSARAVGMTRKSAYRLRSRTGAEGFALAWDRALGWGKDRALDIGLERALLGEEVPVTYAGRCVGVRHRFDNRLAMSVLNALDRRADSRAAGKDDAMLAFHRAMAALEAEHAALEKKGDFRPT